MIFKTPLYLSLFFGMSLFQMYLLLGCNSQDTAVAPRFEDSSALRYGPYRVIKLPISKGVNVLNPLRVTLGPQNKIFATNQSGEVYYLNDSDGDGVEDEAVLYADMSALGLHSPAGLIAKGDTLFVGTRTEIRAFLDKDGDLKPDTSWTFFADIPHSDHPYEWTTGFAVSPDGWLYFNLTTDSWNAGASKDPKGYRGAILRISPDGSVVERMATGIRSVYGMQFDGNGTLFFADNEGGGNPKEELNWLIAGKFYGHNRKKYINEDSTSPQPFALTNDVAPSGIAFNRSGKMFRKTKGELYVAWYGPGERWNRGGVSKVSISKQSDGSFVFSESPIVDIPKLSDITFAADGSLYVSQHGRSDYWYNSTETRTGAFYKIIYDPSLEKAVFPARTKSVSKELSADNIEAGKQLFARNACSACHGVDGKTEMLGPNLNGISGAMTREEILEDILHPSDRIKPAQTGTKIIRKDSSAVLGRIISSSQNEISVILVGNSILNINKSDIARMEDLRKSMMYENLISSLSKNEIDQLLDYIMSLK